MEKENKEQKDVAVKKEKNYKTKDLVLTAVIAFLVGAILASGCFMICGKTNKRGDFRNFKQDGIQRNIEDGRFDNGKMPNNQNPPSGPNQPNTQNPPQNQQNTENAPSNQNTTNSNS